MQEIGAPIGKPGGYALDIVPVGVHCDKGDISRGIPYEGCMWVPYSYVSHSPLSVGPCRLQSLEEWKLSDDSTCTTTLSWGPHEGASAGGECVLFGQKMSGSKFFTALGAMDATTVANAGNAFCVKALPPDVKCEINLPSEIDHGVLYSNEGGFSRRFIDGVVDCGRAPVVAVVGRSNIELATGVSVKVSASMMSNTQLRVQSDMDVKSYAPAGEYSASAIISVSPY
ncbi:hypothetical protein [Serratia sp. NA_13]|uniref:hypothetical protein n=1 Tax=Serratia sp. NA_13 TaxID=3415658 RepID=UPI004046B3E0